MFRKFFQNTRKPQGLGGKIMVGMMNGGHAGVAEWGFSHIAVKEDNSVLDIGCGGGANVKKLCAMCAKGKVTGVDYSSVSVEKSRKVNKRTIAADRCEIMQGDVTSMSFADSSFDIVTAFETVYFW